jgi:anti-anti-sigma factor
VRGGVTGASPGRAGLLGLGERGDGMEIMTDGPTLVLSGDFDVRSTWEVRQAIYERLNGHEQDVVVDLSGVDAIDVTAVKVLAYASREALRGGHHLTLRGCGPSVRRMLHLSHMIRFVEIEREAATA